MRIFAPLYERVLGWSRHRHAERYLAALSFAESSFFPVPVDVMLAPMCLADRARAWRFAAGASIFSVLGGVAGYFVGVAGFELLEPWLRESHYWPAFETSRMWLDRYGMWVIFVAGFSPIPYKVFTIAAGVAALNLPMFIITSLIARGARFFLVAGLIVWGGDKLEATLQQHVERIGWAVVVVVVAIVAWFVVRG
ncbi:MAG: DedA family protein [Proteobacteria bacterium]|nr:DedA family protein [Pseudomonadota bacterium]MDA1064553.1 DedA family protein [Pseudomonadota bacterium]